MTADVIALRAHLVAEAERARGVAVYRQRLAARRASLRMTCSIAAFARDAEWYAADARTATDAWLAADARLRALDGLIARCA